MFCADSTEAEAEEKLKQDAVDPATKGNKPLAKLFLKGSLFTEVWGGPHDAAIGLGLKLPIFFSHAVTSFCEHGQGCDRGGKPQC